MHHETFKRSIPTLAGGLQPPPSALTGSNGRRRRQRARRSRPKVIARVRTWRLVWPALPCGGAAHNPKKRQPLSLTRIM